MDQLPAELDAVQELIRSAGQRVGASVNALASGPGWNTQKLSYLSEALKLLNRSYSLVRAAYGPESCIPSVNDFTVRPVHRESATA